VVAFALLAAALGAYAAARGTSLFAIDSVQVSGASPDDTRRVERALDPLVGESLLSVDAADVDHELAALPDVRVLGIDRAFPRTLRVEVSAERPVAVLRRGADSWLLSERGRVLKAIPGTAPKRLPRIWAARLASTRDGAVVEETEVLRPALALGAVLAADRAFLAGVREARVEDEELALVLRSGPEIRLGVLEDMPLKVAVAKSILATEPGASSGYIDVSVPERAVARLDSQVSG
jgi:cell division protein FtsQ